MTEVNEDLRGIKGWLLVVGLGVVLSPIRMLWELYTSYLPVFTDGIFRDYTDPASENYTLYFGLTFLAELIAYLVLFFLVTWEAYLFFTKSPLFPMVYILTFLLFPVFISFRFWMENVAFPEETNFDREMMWELTQSCIPATIWIPYILLSKRIKNTFVADPPAVD